MVKCHSKYPYSSTSLKKGKMNFKMDEYVYFLDVILD